MNISDLHDYQKRAVRFILDHEEAGLFLDMGMGKTAVTLTALSELSWDIGRILVIAPKRPAIDTWPEELGKWDHLKDLSWALAVGTEKERKRALRKEAYITIINRENVVWLVNQFKKEAWPFDCIVVDELSSFKSSKSQRFRALKKMRPFIRRVIGLTGTPAANGYMDLWAELYILDEGKTLGKTLSGYRSMYFSPGRRNGMIIYDWDLRPGAREEIQEKLKKICISMQAKDYLELPDLMTITRSVRLSPGALAKYRQLEKDLLLEVDGKMIDAVNAAALMTKLLQMAGGTVYGDDGSGVFIHEAKLEALDEILDSSQGENVLVFYAYRHELERLQKRYPEAVEIREPGAIADWKAGKIRILLAHPASAGHGLNLQAGGHIAVWLGLTTSLELYQQACKRLHRQGQTKPVRNYVLLAEDTYDEDVFYKILQRKEQEQNAVLDALRERIKEVQNGNKTG